MPKKPEDQPIVIASTPREMTKLVRKMATDDQFRARLRRSPQAVLAEYHIYLTPEQIPKRVELPPKKDLQEAIRDSPEGSVPLFGCRIPFLFPLSTARRRR